jgi:hypothetical protein
VEKVEEKGEEWNTGEKSYEMMYESWHKGTEKLFCHRYQARVVNYFLILSRSLESIFFGASERRRRKVVAVINFRPMMHGVNERISIVLQVVILILSGSKRCEMRDAGEH